VEQMIYSEIVEDYEEHAFAVTTAATGVPIALSYVESAVTKTFLFEDIRKVEVKHGTKGYDEYSPTTLAYVGGYSFYKTGEKLGYSDPKDGDSVKVKYRGKPAFKLVANTAADYLNLPNAFLKVLKYYCFSQILKLKREFGESDNWTNEYNAALQDFRSWYIEHKPSYGN
ncbi:MAG: hypothetical protein ACYCYE_18435, partial [Clostridia bacterium]